MANRALDSPKRCEQHPLLHVTGVGGGDAVRPPPSVLTASPKRPWFDRWPEIMSACWMTVVLLCICFLTLYVLGVAMTKRQALVVQYNMKEEPRHQHIVSTKNVYYHYVVERGAAVEFLMFSSYLTKMARLYQNLRFNVYFLTAESVRRNVPRPRHRRLQLFTPPHVTNLCPKMNERNANELKRFLTVHPNVNVTIMPLSDYMASTPLKDKWRSLPTRWIAFYARVVSVWRCGGIGVDLVTANAEHLVHRRSDPRKTAVLTEYNDGRQEFIHLETTQDMFQRMQNEELPILLYLMKFLSSFFDRSVPLIGNTSSITYIDGDTYEKKKLDSDAHADAFKKFTGDKRTSDETSGPKKTVIKYTFKNRENNTAPLSIKTVTNIDSRSGDMPDATRERTLPNSTSGVPKVDNVTFFFPSGDYEMLPPIYFYTFTLTSNEAGPNYESNSNANSQPKNPRFGYHDVKKQQDNNALTLELNGDFVSSFSRFHPLLGHIIYNDFLSMSPRFAIENALTAHCSDLGVIENYCKFINII